MTWRLVSASEVGTSHVAVERTCEDSSHASVQRTSSGLEVLSVFVADGAGSAARGGEGAAIAVQAAVDHIAERLRQDEFCCSDKTADELVAAVRTCIHATAEAASIKDRDFACTFLGVVSSSLGTLAFQIGDGGMVVDVGDGMEVPVVPMTGEYANMTRFVTDDDAMTNLETRTYDRQALRVAAFSDGLQRLALNMLDGTAHAPFFTPFFDVLARATPEQEVGLHGALVRFLSSSSVNGRTDDDKTLALAVLVP